MVQQRDKAGGVVPPCDWPPLVLWAGCLWKHGIIERAESMHESGFASMSLFMKDLQAWEEHGGTLARLRSELDARHAPVSCIDPYLGWYPGFDPRAASGTRAAFLRATEEDVFRFVAATGAPSASLVAPYQDDGVPFDAVVDSLGHFADRSAAAGLRLHLEVVPTSNVPDLYTALRLVTAVDRPNLGLLLDTYNLARSGTDPREIDGVPRELVFAIQLADGAADPVNDDYRLDSLHNRRQPGEGELPVAEMVERVLRKGPLPPLGPEIFHDELSAVPARLAARRCAEATRRFLAALGGHVPEDRRPQQCRSGHMSA
jgi:sugar phosphate isomerase/epimerase